MTKIGWEKCNLPESCNDAYLMAFFGGIEAYKWEDGMEGMRYVEPGENAPGLIRKRIQVSQIAENKFEATVEIANNRTNKIIIKSYTGNCTDDTKIKWDKVAG